MKNSHTGREGGKKGSIVPTKKRGSFLERFKGRTIQMSKEGHVGVVNSTKMPIKPSHENPNYSYNQEEYMPYTDSSKKKSGNQDGYQRSVSKSNYEALSPMKRSVALPNKFSAPSDNTTYSFASNFRRAQQALEDNYNDKPQSSKRGMSEIGNKIMRYQKSENFTSIDQRANSNNYSVPRSQPLYQSSFAFRSSVQLPNTGEGMQTNSAT